MTKQEAGKDLDVTILNLLPEVSTLKSLVVINLQKVDRQFCQFVIHMTSF